jgi:hypothetical protein
MPDRVGQTGERQRTGKQFYSTTLISGTMAAVLGPL